ncbi:tumor necrosis factor receptor superfamily member wengen [Battus philenor]|uniref:tumor necrosis factor receptor superfamily member wengen n=1 Tax=Battus philenor TaxID=42288 RepID=UPI0035D11791
MKLSIKVMRGKIHLCLLVALALGSASGSGPCERGRSWWHRQSGTCLPCTRCDPTHLAVKYPCEIHRDTICQSLYEVRIFPFNVPRKNNGSNASERSSDYEYYEYSDYNGEVADKSDGELEWDVQTSTLTLAVSGCVVFFAVVLILSLYHAKQWKVLKQALKSDVQDLSARLKLMEAGGESPAEPIMPVDHHIYCNIHAGKDALLVSDGNTKKLGNVYTQEKLSP